MPLGGRTFRPYSNHNPNRLARFAIAIGRLASNRWGASLSAASVTARISSEPMPLKRAARAAPLPSHAISCRACAWRPARRNDPDLMPCCDWRSSTHLSEQAGEGREVSGAGDHHQTRHPRCGRRPRHYRAQERPPYETLHWAIGATDYLNTSPPFVRGSGISNRRCASVE